MNRFYVILKEMSYVPHSQKPLTLVAKTGIVDFQKLLLWRIFHDQVFITSNFFALQQQFTDTNSYCIHMSSFVLHRTLFEF